MRLHPPVNLPLYVVHPVFREAQVLHQLLQEKSMKCRDPASQIMASSMARPILREGPEPALLLFLLAFRQGP